MQGLGLNSLVRNIFGALARQTVAALVGLVTYAIIARVYGAEGNGVYALALLLPSILATFLNLGIAAANVYHIGSSQISVRQTIHANLRIFLFLAPFGTLVGLVALYWGHESFFPGIDRFVLFLALAGFPLSLLNTYLASIIQGLQKFKEFNFIQLTQPLVLLLLVALCSFSGNNGIVLVVAAQLVSQLVSLIVCIGKLRPMLKPKSDEVEVGLPDYFLRKTLNYGLKAYLSNILAFLNYKADIFLVNLFLGPAAVGVYVIGVALVERLWLLSKAVSTVLLPRLAELSGEEETRKNLTPLISRWVLALTFCASALLAIAAKPLILLVFGDDYLGAVFPLWILLPGIVLTSASRVLANDIAARGRPALNMYSSLVVVVANILGNILLIPKYGLAGAAAATSAAYALNLCFRLLIYSRLSDNHWADCLFLKRKDFHFFLAALRHSFRN